jgi:hypothetical protein
MDSAIPSGRFPSFIRLVVRGSVPIERDPKHAAHAAHGVVTLGLDPDAYTPLRMTVCLRAPASRNEGSNA